MHLGYLAFPASEEALMLRNSHAFRIEMFVLRNDDSSYSLVALSARASGAGLRAKVQGPYQTRALAVAARSAIANELIARRFEVDADGHPFWRVRAQREIREVRNKRQENIPDCRFDPNDVYW